MKELAIVQRTKLAVARTTCSALSVVISLLLFRQPLASLAALAVSDDRYTHTALVPVLSVLLIYARRKSIFGNSRCSIAVGIPLFAAAMLLYFLHRPLSGPNPADRLFLTILAIVSVWIAAFVLCYGMNSFRAAAFPLVLLVMMAPLPTAAVDTIVLILQRASSEMSDLLFRIVGVPILRTGFTISLPGADIDIAPQCSGIRSSVSLVLASMLAGQLLLKSTWKRICLSALAIPIVIFKNAVRIVTISCLGIYVDPSFFRGELHRNSGIPFSLLAIAMLGGLLLLLKDRLPERQTQAGSPGSPG